MPEQPLPPAHAREPATLHRHADTPCAVVQSIKALLRMTEGGMLSIAYLLEGRIEQLRIPPDATPRRVEGLWRRTCFEAFVNAKGSPAYYEFNFSPSGEWAAYAFRRYRDGVPLEDDELDPRITARRSEGVLEVHARIRLDRLPALVGQAGLRVGVSAVVEDCDGRLSYWALEHGPGKPDFHRSDTFLLEI